MSTSLFVKYWYTSVDSLNSASLESLQLSFQAFLLIYSYFKSSNAPRLARIYLLSSKIFLIDFLHNFCMNKLFYLGILPLYLTKSHSGKPLRNKEILLFTITS